MRMAREKRQEGSNRFAGSEKKDGRAQRGITVRWPSAEAEVAAAEFVKRYARANKGATQPDAFGYALSVFATGTTIPALDPVTEARFAKYIEDYRHTNPAATREEVAAQALTAFLEQQGY